MRYLIALLILAGCTSVPEGRFRKPDGTQATAQDVKECEQELAKSAPETGGYGIYAFGAAPPVVKRCLELRGYVDTQAGEALGYK